MEFGESFDDTVRREVLEEYGTVPLVIEYLATKNVIREHNGRMIHWIKNLHLVLVDPEKVINNEPDKIDEIGWFILEDLPTPLHSQIADEVPMIKSFFRSKELK